MADLSLAEKAAVVVLSLGEETAAEVFRHLDTKEIKKLSQHMDGLMNLDNSRIESILSEFHTDLNEGRFVLPNGINYFQGVIQKALGPEAGAKLLKEIEDESLKGLEVLDDVDSRMLANIIQKEHPQTIALVMAHTEPFKAAQTVAALPEKLQVEVLYRIARLDAVSKDVLQEVEEALLQEIRGMGALGQHQAGGVKLVADILNQMEKSDEVRIIENIQDMNPEMGDEIRQLMFVFEDIVLVDDRGIQALLKEVDHESLVLALRTANDDVKEKIFRNLSKRAAQLLQEDMETTPPVRLSDVEKAQQTIVRTALRLEEEGQLVVMSRGGDDAFV